MTLGRTAGIDPFAVLGTSPAGVTDPVDNALGPESLSTNVSPVEPAGSRVRGQSGAATTAVAAASGAGPAAPRIDFTPEPEDDIPF